MFILIAPVHRFNFEESYDPFRRRADAIKRYFESREQPDTANSPSSGNPYGSWEMMARETQIISALIETRERRAQSNDFNSDNYGELLIEQNEDILHVHIFGKKYTPCCPDPYDPLEQLNKDIDLLSDEITEKSPYIKKVVCHFDRVEYFNTEALSHFIKLKKLLSRLGIELELSGVKPQLREILEITHLDSFFKIK